MIEGILHATFLSSNLNKSRRFYEDVLGLRSNPERPEMSYDGIWYDISEGQQIHLMLLPNPEAGIVRPKHGGRDRHIAFCVSNFEELASELRQGGVPYTLSQSGRKALFCRDPDGNALEFVGKD